MWRKILTLTIVITFVLLAGCAQKKVVKPKVDPAIEELNRAADDIQADLKKLSKIKQVGYKKVQVHESPDEGPLSKKITLDWTGRLEPVLQMVANKVEYEIKIRGERPAQPVIVSLDKTDTKIFTVLEELGWKSGRHQISVNEEKNIVQLTYFEDEKAAGGKHE